MGVYIKNIDIPEIKRGVAAIINIDDIVFFKTADDILLVPDHGDLIDRDALMPKVEEKGLRLMAIGIEKIVNAPTVIPAERSVDKDKDVPCKGAERSEE